VALVTGGNGGIGLGMAQGFAQAGASVVIAGRNAAKSEAAAAELAKLGVKTAVVEVNVADENSCTAMVEATVEKMGRLDILVNNAGINIRKRPETYKMSEWREVLSINLDGAFYCSHAAYPALKKAGGGKIINIGSMMSIFGAPFATPYAASKGGIVQMTRMLAVEWARDGIRVNAVAPATVLTPSRDKALADPARRQMMLDRLPQGRFPTAEDIADAMVFLAGPKAKAITGHILPVDAGLLAV
jgi:2-deoxy-D-gluconate 3-dehydrogenase